MIIAIQIKINCEKLFDFCFKFLLKNQIQQRSITLYIREKIGLIILMTVELYKRLDQAVIIQGIAPWSF